MVKFIDSTGKDISFSDAVSSATIGKLIKTHTGEILLGVVQAGYIPLIDLKRIVEFAEKMKGGE